jgi:hypothetical protein
MSIGAVLSSSATGTTGLTQYQRVFSSLARVFFFQY